MVAVAVGPSSDIAAVVGGVGVASGVGSVRPPHWGRMQTQPSPVFGEPSLCFWLCLCVGSV